MKKPFMSLQEQLVEESIQANTAPADQIRKARRTVLQRPKYGYRRTPLTVEDVLGLSRYRTVSQQERVYWSGSPGEINAGTRNALGTW